MNDYFYIHFSNNKNHHLIMGGHGIFAFNLVVKLSVELDYVFVSLRL
jgi:hypothetical protein